MRFTFLITLLGIAAVVAALRWGTRAWRSETGIIRQDLTSTATSPTASYQPSMLSALPAPVRRYLEQVLTPGQPLITHAEFSHSGTFNMSTGEPNWKPFTSTQLNVTSRPGFDWDARITMSAGIPVFVRDAYVKGEGILEASLFGLIPVARLRGGEELAKGELMRFLAESPWYPTVLLPGQGVVWEEVHPTLARATLRDGNVSTTVDFHFGPNGMVERIYSPARTRITGKTSEQLPWQGHFWNYIDTNGMKVPAKGEVAWLLPSGPVPYWRGTLERATYTFHR